MIIPELASSGHDVQGRIVGALLLTATEDFTQEFLNTAPRMALLTPDS